MTRIQPPVRRVTTLDQSHYICWNLLVHNDNFLRKEFIVYFWRIGGKSFWESFLCKVLQVTMKNAWYHQFSNLCFYNGSSQKEKIEHKWRKYTPPLMLCLNNQAWSHWMPPQEWHQGRKATVGETARQKA